MARLLLVVVMLIISGIVYLVKAGVGTVTGKDVNFQDESQKIMQKTAKGINWMNEQWEKAKNGNNNALLSSNSFNSKSAMEIIAIVRADPDKYGIGEEIFIEQAFAKMNNRQFDDARKLMLQVHEGDARTLILDEIELKRNA